MSDEERSRGSAEVHLVLTGDVVRSREVPDREGLRQQLTGLLEGLNERDADILRVPLSITAGDEFQGLSRPAGRVVELADAVQRELFPVRARLGIGIGAITTAFAARSQEMDGPAFVLAREALEAAKKCTPDAWLYFRTSNGTFDLAANAIAVLLGAVKRRWKALHWRRAALRDQGLDEEDIGEREGVTQVAISFSLETARYSAGRRAESHLADLLERRWVSEPKETEI